MSAFILALVMILGMIPTGIFKLGTSAAEPTPDPNLGKTFLHASYAASVNVDGTQDAGYRFDVPVGAVRLGAAWNKDGLYLSFNSADVKIETLKVNGTAVDLAGAGKDTCWEVKAPLPANLNGTNTLAVKLEGSDEVTLQLAFDTQPAKTNLNFSANYGAYIADDENKTVVELDSFRNETKGSNAANQLHRDLGKVSSNMLAYSLDASTVIEMDVQVDYLPNGATVPGSTSKNWDVLRGGLNITVLDADDTPDSTGDNITEAMYIGMYQDEGTLYLLYWDNEATNKYVSVPVGAYVAGASHHLRVEYTYTDNTAANTDTNIADNDLVTAKYYLDGKLVAKASSAKITGAAGFGTKSANQIQFMTTALKDYYGNTKATDDTRSCVTVSNCTVTKTQPAIEVVKEIASLGKLESVDADAVTELRKAYEDLADADKAKVTNSAYLTAVEDYLAQVQYVHAEFSTAATTVDGALTEKAYRNFVKVNDSVKLTASWNGKYLFLGFKGTTAAVSELKLNGEVASYTSKAGTDSVEYQIALNLPDYSQEYTLSFKLGETEWSGKVVFDTISAGAAKNLSANYGAYWLDTADKSVVELDSFNNEDRGSATANQKHRDLGGWSGAIFAPSLEEDTVVEMDVLVDYLPDGATLPAATATALGRDLMKGGLNITVLDDETLNKNGNYIAEALWSGLYQSGGKLYFAYYDNATTAKFVSALVGEYVPGTTYSLRIEYAYAENTVSKAADGKENNAANDMVSAKYYINGKLVGTSADAKLFSTSNFSAGNGNQVMILAQGLGNNTTATNETRVDVTVSKLYVSKTSPAIYTGLVDVEKVEQFISAIDTTVTLDSETAITKARQAYDGLDDSLKALVSNYAVLEAAESQLKVLKNSYLHAVFSTSKITVDGNLGEAAYKRVLPLGSNVYLSLAWDTTNLYLGIAGPSVLDLSALKINGNNVDLSSIAHGTGARELAVSLDSVGLGAYTSGANISFTVNGKTWAGKLVLDTVDHEIVKRGSLYWGAADLDSAKTGITLDTFKGSDNTYRSCVLYSNDKLASVAGANTVVEFDFTPTYLPDSYAVSSTPSRAFLVGGVAFTIRDERNVVSSGNGTEAFLFGFGKKNGQMYLIYWYNNGTKHVADEVAIGTAENFHVRVEYVYGTGKEVTANYYINGVLVLERAASRLVSSDTQSFAFSTPGLNNMQVYAGVQSGKQSDTNKVVATISNMSYGHTQPSLVEDLTVNVEQVEQQINEIGAVTMDRKGYIESTLARFESLSPTAQKLVKNADVLMDAVNQLKVLENSFLHAAFAATPVVVDGVTDEEFFRRNLALGNTKFGAAWDSEYLYLYFADTAAPTVDKLVINNVTVDTTGTAGTAAREIKIALADLGITNLNDTYPVSIQIGSKSWSGKLALDPVDFEAGPVGSLYYGAAASSDRLSVVMNSMNPDSDGKNIDRSLVLFSNSKLTAVSGAATVVEFDFDPAYMPDTSTNTQTPSRTFMTGGVAFTLRDDRDVVASGYGTKAFQFGFGGDS